MGGGGGAVAPVRTRGGCRAGAANRAVVVRMLGATGEDQGVGATGAARAVK